MVHEKGKKGLDNMPHEAVNPRMVPSIESAFNQSNDRKVIEELHERDKSSKWIDVVRDAFGRPVLEDYGCYGSLFAKSSATGQTSRQFPQLVSFVGDTNTGKSAIIKLLINLALSNGGSHVGGDFASPVVGSAADKHESTSGGLSLYKEPATSEREYPLLFVDSEGFQVGERTPLGSRRRWTDGKVIGGRGETATYPRTRPIEWAESVETRGREFIVSKIYPRLLYAFSDCVVFVTCNPKTFQSTALTKLIDWGVANMETSVNQPILPHCIVIINYSDACLEEGEWDSGRCTEALLSTVDGPVNYTEGLSCFRSLVEYWKNLGRRISSLQDLILCYYSSFKVIRIPIGSQFNRVANQVSKLRDLIQTCCLTSVREKKLVNMQTDVRELESYLQSSFDHFTKHMDLPFNFVHASSMRNPTPDDFEAHMLRLCLAVQGLHSNPQQCRIALEQMSSYIASCVFLEWARYRKGQLEEHASELRLCFERAISEFHGKHAPCGYVRAGKRGYRKCSTVQARHRIKGHQDDHGIIAYGDFVAPFGGNFDAVCKDRFNESLTKSLSAFRYGLGRDDPAMHYEHTVWDHHLECAGLFFETCANLRLNLTCLCCLVRAPEVALPCGHVLCRSCLEVFGRRENQWLVVERCRLHRHGGWLESPMRLRTKAPEEGICVLSLDAGGIRGIVQLEVLRAIEVAMEGHLRMHNLFDLIVGAGSGGLIAALLVEKGMTTDQCLDTFAAVHDAAYGDDDNNVSVLRTVENVLTDKRKMRSSRLHKALKEVFAGNRPLFGKADSFCPGARIAISSFNGAEHQPVLFANYRRPPCHDLNYSQCLSSDPRDEVRIWEAIAASMADRTSFLPIRNKRRRYAHNVTCKTNPAVFAASEAQQIWKGATSSTLVCLSLGTGQDSSWVAETLAEETVGEASEYRSPLSSTKSALDRLVRRHKSSKGENLAAEAEWRELKLEYEAAQPHAKAYGLLRLNPDFGNEEEIPGDDDHEAMRSLQLSARTLLQQPQEREAVRRVAHRLVAACFYLRVNQSFLSEEGTLMVDSEIACRFEGDTKSTKGLGRILRDQFIDGFEPYFEVRPAADCARMSSRIAVVRYNVDLMVDLGAFERPTVIICVDASLGRASSIQLFFAPNNDGFSLGYPLSGLPRELMDAHHGTARFYDSGMIAESGHQMLSSARLDGVSSPQRHKGTRSRDSEIDRGRSALNQSPVDSRLDSGDGRDGRTAGTTHRYGYVRPQASSFPTSAEETALLPQRLVPRSVPTPSRVQSVLLPSPVVLSPKVADIPGPQGRQYESPTESTISSEVSVGSPGVSPFTTSEVRINRHNFSERSEMY